MSNPVGRRAQIARAKRFAIAAGYSIREGCYFGTTDDVLGRWYTCHRDDTRYQPLGSGHASQAEAWLAIASASYS